MALEIWVGLAVPGVILVFVLEPPLSESQCFFSQLSLESHIGLQDLLVRPQHMEEALSARVRFLLLLLFHELPQAYRLLDRNERNPHIRPVDIPCFDEPSEKMVCGYSFLLLGLLLFLLPDINWLQGSESTWLDRLRSPCWSFPLPPLDRLDFVLIEMLLSKRHYVIVLLVF